MADKRISQLNEILDIQDNDLVVLVDTSEAQTARATKLDLEQSFRLGQLSGTTDDITEGTTNLYYTDVRFDNRFSLKTTDDLSEGTTNLYLSASNLITLLGTSVTTDDIPEGVTNLYYTQIRFDNAFSGKSTDDLTEGSNLYYTEGRFTSSFAAKSTDNLSEGTLNLYYTEARFDQRLATKTTDEINEGNVNFYYKDSKVDARINLLLGQPNGIASLDGSGLIPSSLLPPVSKTEIFIVSDLSERDALSNVQEGDFVKVLDFDAEGRERTYIYDGFSWVDLKSADDVTSINGFNGAVILTTDEIGEGGSNLYYTEARVNANFAAKSTDNLSEGIANLYYTDARVENALNSISIDALSDVNIVAPPTVPGYYLAWSGTEWIPAPPQTFGDTKDLKATNVDQFPGFLDEKVLGTAGRISITEVDVGGGDKRLQFDIDTDFGLGDLGNVDLTGLADNNFLRYDAATMTWVPTASTGGGVTDHGALLGLNDDDHPQYLLTDGTRILGGNMSLGNNKLTNSAAPTEAKDVANLETTIVNSIIFG